MPTEENDTVEVDVRPWVAQLDRMRAAGLTDDQIARVIDLAIELADIWRPAADHEARRSER